MLRPICPIFEMIQYTRNLVFFVKERFGDSRAQAGKAFTVNTHFVRRVFVPVFK